MPVTMTKAELNKLLSKARQQGKAAVTTKMTKADVEKVKVEERRTARERYAHSKFMARSLSIYKGQVARAEQLADGRTVAYSLDEFREDFAAALARRTCEYCTAKLTLRILQCDHRNPIKLGGLFERKNNAFVCESCNWQKGGEMTEADFRHFLRILQENFSERIVTDIQRRLSTGGKWLAKGF